MNVRLLAINEIGSEWTFRVTFENSSQASLAFPVGAVKRSGARIGLHFSLQGKELEPIDVLLISPRSADDEVIVLPGHALTLDLVAKAEHKSGGAYALAFGDATYKIESSSTYRVQFVWHDMKSNVIDWRI